MTFGCRRSPELPPLVVDQNAAWRRLGSCRRGASRRRLRDPRSDDPSPSRRVSFFTLRAAEVTTGAGRAARSGAGSTTRGAANPPCWYPRGLVRRRGAPGRRSRHGSVPEVEVLFGTRLAVTTLVDADDAMVGAEGLDLLGELLAVRHERIQNADAGSPLHHRCRRTTWPADGDRVVDPFLFSWIFHVTSRSTGTRHPRSHLAEQLLRQAADRGRR